MRRRTFHLLFPLLAWWMARKPSARTFILVAAGLVVGGMLLRDSIWTHELAPLRMVDDDRFNLGFIEDIYFPTWARFDGLLAGVVLATIKCCRVELWIRLQRRSNPVLLLALAVSGIAVIAVIVYVLAVLIVGALLHYAIERPFLQWRGRFLGRSESGAGRDRSALA